MQSRQATRTQWMRPMDDHDPLGVVKGIFAAVALGVAVWPLVILIIRW